MIPEMMPIATVPHWNTHGVLPPIAPGELGNSLFRSPYAVGLPEVVDCLSISTERIAILDGFLRFRSELHRVGLVSGFQWLNGSFLENIEDLEDRQPNDLDVVTFYAMPTGQSQQSLFAGKTYLFDNTQLRQDYKIDGYFRELGANISSDNITMITYWYSMWSHRRNGLWKGFLQVDLDSANDEEARNRLDAKKEIFQ